VSITQELLTFGVGVDTSNAEAGLASLGASADGVAVGLEDRLSGASSELKEMGKQSSGAARGIQGLAAVVSLVDPRLGQVIRSVGTLARGLSVLRLGLGPAALAVGALTAGLALYQREQQRAADEMAAAKTRADNLSAALEGVAASGRELEDQLRLINGEIDSFGLAAEAQSQAVQTASDAAVAAYDEEIQAARDRIAALDEEIRQGRNVSNARTEEVRALSRLRGARELEIDRASRQIEVIQLMAEYRRESRQAQEDEAEAARQAAAADRERSAALSELIEKEDQRSRLKGTEDTAKTLEVQRTLADLEREVATIRADAAAEQVTENQRILDSYDAQLERLAEIQRIAGESAEVDAARADVIAAREEAEFQMFLDHQAEKARIEDEAHQKTLDDIETERQARMQAQQDISSSLASFGQLSSQIARQRAEEADQTIQALRESGQFSEAQLKKRQALEMAAAKRALDMSKRLGFAQIAIDTAVGIQKALSNSAGNPILAALSIASVIAGAATQTAAVASQKLHQGGQLAPDEQTVRTVVLRDERIDETGRVMSPEASRRLERGESAGRAQVVPVPQYQHFGVFFADVVESGGTPMHDLIYQGRDVGRAGY
jgi:colicin import membrane protein